MHTNEGNSKLRVTAWIAMPPGEIDEPETAIRFADDLWNLLFSYGSIATSYRPWNVPEFPPLRLNQLLAAKALDCFTFSSLDDPDRTASVIARVVLTHPDCLVDASTAYIEIEPNRRGDVARTAISVAAFLQRCFQHLNPAAAFVSASDMTEYGKIVGDHAMGTAKEIDRRRMLTSWSDVRRFARGAFWGNGFGLDLCNLLGGQAQIIRNAPVFKAEPVGRGVWLQLTETFPPDQNAITLLENYLSPLLNWTADDLAR